MPQNDPLQNQNLSLTFVEEQNKRIKQAYVKFFERISPWLLDFGGWIFGGLTGYAFLSIDSIFKIGPIDPIVMLATAAFALSLPLNLTGLLLLRLVRDFKKVRFEEEFEHAFQDVDTTIQATSYEALESLQRRRTRYFLSYSLVILTLCSLLALIGTIAILGYMAWWIGVIFICMAIICPFIVIGAFVTSRIPDSPEVQEQK